MYYFRKCMTIYGKSVVFTCWPWIKVSLHNLPAEETPYVFVENHTSSFDPFVQSLLPFQLVQAAKGWTLRFPVLGFIARLAGYLDVDKLEGKMLLEKTEKLLRDGVSVIFFPEGTRNTEVEMGPFHGIAFRAAFDTGTTVVPVIITGIADKPHKGSLIMHPGKVDIYCLKPIRKEEYKNLSHLSLKKMTRERMEEFLYRKR